MKGLFILACTLAAAAAPAMPLRAVRRHLDPPGRADCPPPWCEQAPTIHRLAAPEDPSMYLGDVISYERPSDWRDFAPLRDQVATLTDGLTSTLGKVTAIADWVKHSKVPGPHTYTSWPPSIIDVWGFRHGQCEEASFLLTAMLRLAGIPAMRFTTWNSEHAAVRAYVDGNWIVVDATPTTPDNSGPATVYNANDPAVVPAFQERPLTVLDNVEVPGTDTRVATFTLFSNEPIHEPATLSQIGLQYATVAFPVTNEPLYYDADTQLFVRHGQSDQRVTITYHIDAVDGSCLNDRQSWYATPIRHVQPGLLWRTIDPTQPPAIGTFYPLGYIETALPTCGAWRIVYALSNQDLDAPSAELAYEEFDLGGPNDFVLVRPELLQPAAGADMYCFRALVETLEKLPAFEQLGGVVPR
jgi:transglutaminase-like putative cysteine protease